MKKILLLMLIILACDKQSNHHGSKLSGEESSSAFDLSDLAIKTMEEDFMTLVNEHRSRQGLKELTLSSELSKIALGHSTNMAKDLISFGHTGFSDRCSEAKAQLHGGNLCSENVAKGQSTATKVFTAWMNSPGHRANIENQRHTHTGIAFHKNSSGVLYWTQILIEKN